MSLILRKADGRWCQEMHEWCRLGSGILRRLSTATNFRTRSMTNRFRYHGIRNIQETVTRKTREKRPASLPSSRSWCRRVNGGWILFFFVFSCFLPIFFKSRDTGKESSTVERSESPDGVDNERGSAGDRRWVVRLLSNRRNR